MRKLWRIPRKQRITAMLVVFAFIVFASLAWASWYEDQLDPPYHRVESGVYIGEAVDRPPRGTKAVVNLCGRKDTYEVEALFHEPILEGPNSATPNVEWLERAVEFVRVQRESGKLVYVHCRAGVNRSATVVVAYLMREHGWTRDNALQFLREKRGKVRPDPGLMKLLAEWELKLRGQGVIPAS